MLVIHVFNAFLEYIFILKKKLIKTKTYKKSIKCIFILKKKIKFQFFLKPLYALIIAVLNKKISYKNNDV